MHHGSGDIVPKPAAGAEGYNGYEAEPIDRESGELLNEKDSSTLFSTMGAAVLFSLIGNYVAAGEGCRVKKQK